MVLSTLPVPVALSLFPVALSSFPVENEVHDYI